VNRYNFGTLLPNALLSKAVLNDDEPADPQYRNRSHDGTQNSLH
jgi:hypothetical protein